MKVLFATLLLLAGCAAQPAIETVDEPVETLALEEAIMVVPAESPRQCEKGYVPVCRMHYVSKEDCRCVRRDDFNGPPGIIR